MEINRENIFNIISMYDIKPSKDFGQNFLCEPKICCDIINLLNINDSDYVLEIGPGLGSLTHFIDEKTKKIDLIDIDTKFVSILEHIYPNITIYNQNALKSDVSKYTKIVSNLPYNITTDLISYILCNGVSCKRYVLMCQTEAFDHVSSLSGENYGPLSVLIHLLGNVKKEFVVKSGNFVPVPKCTSTVFSIDVLAQDRESCVATYKLAKNLFLQRRKTIYNNLSNFLKNKEEALNILNKANIPQNARPENITPAKYKELTSLLRK